MSDMKAGRELDALVAERVMGMKTSPHSFIHNNGVTEPYKVTEYYADGIRCKDYSTSIAAAWLVVEKMEESLNGINIRSVVPSSFPTYYIVHFGDERRRVTEFTLPLAICRAALKATESE